ncbi:hypothetical protein VD0004_g9160 [Verticillium dahliae]|nr:hypothetical protein VD0004_g9160 [Verticillium dahliae]
MLIWATNASLTSSHPDGLTGTFLGYINTLLGCAL